MRPGNFGDDNGQTKLIALPLAHACRVVTMQETFEGEIFVNWWRIKNSWRNLSWITSATNYAYVATNFVEKTFADGPNTSKFAKVFYYRQLLPSYSTVGFTV